MAYLAMEYPLLKKLQIFICMAYCKQLKHVFDVLSCLIIYKIKLIKTIQYNDCIVIYGYG